MLNSRSKTHSRRLGVKSTTLRLNAWLKSPYR
jgi:hypothetical protein